MVVFNVQSGQNGSVVPLFLESHYEGSCSSRSIRSLACLFCVLEEKEPRRIPFTVLCTCGSLKEPFSLPWGHFSNVYIAHSMKNIIYFLFLFQIADNQIAPKKCVCVVCVFFSSGV